MYFGRKKSQLSDSITIYEMKKIKNYTGRPPKGSHDFGEIRLLKTPLLKNHSYYSMDRLGEITQDSTSRMSVIEATGKDESFQNNQYSEDQKEFAITLDKLDGYVNQMQNLMNQSDAQEIVKDFNSVSQEYSKSIRSIKSQLEGLSKKVKALADDPKLHSEYKIRQNTLNIYSTRLQSIMDRFNRMQQSFREFNLGKIKKTLELSNITATEEDVVQMLESGDYSICDDIAVTAQKKETLRAIQDRHNEMLKLEEGLRKLAEIFTQISLLINENAESINRIEQNYGNVADYLGEATVQLTKAVEHKRSASKKKLCIGITVTIIIIILALIIGLSIGLKK